jgi:shikimate 5-dehydrogenase
MGNCKSTVDSFLTKIDADYIFQVVISTLPAQAGFTLPLHLLETATPPVIFDVVYKPAMTKLIAQVQ